MDMPDWREDDDFRTFSVGMRGLLACIECA